LKNFLFHFDYCKKDYLLAKRLVSNIKDIYPKAKILALSDGFEGNLSCNYVNSIEALKNKNIVDFIHRKYSILASQDSNVDWFLQLDPDSYLLREITFPDLKDLWYGQIIHHKELKATWGCCDLKHRSLIEKLASGTFKPMTYEKGYSEDLTIATYLNTFCSPVKWEDVLAKPFYSPKLLKFKGSIIHPYVFPRTYI